ncbi:MAG: hypothetical protein NXI30_02600 [bacterium]|nr:hypothetical protein [bacterium]
MAAAFCAFGCAGATIGPASSTLSPIGEVPQARRDTIGVAILGQREFRTNVLVLMSSETDARGAALRLQRSLTASHATPVEFDEAGGGRVFFFDIDTPLQTSSGLRIVLQSFFVDDSAQSLIRQIAPRMHVLLAVGDVEPLAALEASSAQPHAFAVTPDALRAAIHEVGAYVADGAGSL